MTIPNIHLISTQFQEIMIIIAVVRVFGKLLQDKPIPFLAFRRRTKDFKLLP